MEAAGQVVAHLELLALARGHLAAGVGQHIQGATPGAVPGGAGGGALAPVHPGTPIAILAVHVAFPGVAHGDHLFVLGLAWGAAILRRHLDGAVAAFGSSPARAGAGAPVRPLAPLAVDGCGRHLLARLQLSDDPVAAVPALGPGRGHDGPLPALHARDASAAAPGGPTTQLAVVGMRKARLGVAGGCLLQLHPLAEVPVGAGMQQLPLPVLLPPVAAAVATRPLRPGGQRAVVGDLFGAT